MRAAGGDGLQVDTGAPIRRRPYDAIKRALDILFSLLLLIVLSPVFALVSVLVLLNLGRPVLFVQTRPGRNGRLFRLYKFRSMHALNAAAEQEPAAASDVAAVACDAARLTRFGRVLRGSSLDELPELVNILRGDMSFVGPRPLLTEYLPLYSPEQARRHQVRPGLTGLAQVSGRNALDWQSRFRLDVEYVDRRSFTLDARILARTVAAVFTARGVTGAGTATMQPFTGNGD